VINRAILILGFSLASSLYADQLRDESRVRVALLRGTQRTAPDADVVVVVYMNDTMLVWDADSNVYRKCNMTARDKTVVNQLHPSGLGESKNSFGTLAAVDVSYDIIVFHTKIGYRRTNAADFASTEAQFRQTVAGLRSLGCPDRNPWIPPKALLGFWLETEVPPEKVVPFPADWPAPEPTSRPFSFFEGARLVARVEGSQFYNVRRQVESLIEPTQRFVQINNRPYIVRIHASLPGEWAWLSEAQ
jgi:hypothetical protein